MRLLFDHNLSPRLVSRLADLFPNSEHIFNIGMAQSADLDVWNYARAQGFTLVSRDSDYNELLILRGFPPKVIWIRRGNCSTAEIEAMLRENIDSINQLSNDEFLGILALY
jgi:predicted nuclease of predicted toxin-antitoxin system